MGFDCYTGNLGAGKSLDATLVILNYLFQGKRVISNYPINEKAIKTKTEFSYFSKNKMSKIEKKNGFSRDKRENKFTYVKPSDLTVLYLLKFYMKYHKDKKKESQTLLVIDEASMNFNARDWNAKERKNWLTFFRHSRKFGYDIILITQNLSDLDKQIRGMIDYQVVHKKLSSFKIFKFLAFLKINVFLKIFIWDPNRNRLKDHTEFFVYRKYYSTLYDTFDLFINIYEMFDFDEIPQELIEDAA